ncbi:O-antigen ligase RfaL, partial [Salmonella enterica subsp. enterica serovar Infantis]
LSRGAWLAVVVVGVLWAILNRQWKQMGSGAAILVIAGVLVITQQSHKTDQERLLYKIKQTDSSNRYTKGNQGTAWI